MYVDTYDKPVIEFSLKFININMLGLKKSNLYRENPENNSPIPGFGSTSSKLDVGRKESCDLGSLLFTS